MGISSFSAKIKEISDETPTVKTFRFEKPTGFSYKAGQYCSIAYPNRDVAGRRSYSFSNCEADSDFFAITVKKHGEFTQKMFTLSVGDGFEVKGPFGKDFIFDESCAKDTVFLAGGVGVTPFIAALQYADYKKLGCDLVLFASNKTEDEIIAKNQLDSYAKNNEGITVVNTLTKQEDWQGESGRINADLIKKYAKKDLASYQYFICGPGNFIDAMKTLVSELGVPQENIIVEDWGI